MDAGIGAKATVLLAMPLTPVRLPPGWLRLATSPCLTGSPDVMKTIGMVVVTR